MKLSDAMMLGSTTCKMVPGDMRSCAFGLALNAVGDRTHKDLRYSAIVEQWPWLAIDGSTRYDFALTPEARSIYGKFDCEVCNGDMTYEQLVDYVRSIEPDCGICNQFSCTCVKDEVAEETTAVTYA